MYAILRRRNRPRLTGCNMAVWREDYERINGFDENYVGWGLEDCDLQLRLGQLGVRFRSILNRTAVYHLWHPVHSTFARNGLGTPNLRYFRRDNVLTRCRQGLVKLAADGSVQDAAEEDRSFPYILSLPATTAPARDVRKAA